MRIAGQTLGDVIQYGSPRYGILQVIASGEATYCTARDDRFGTRSATVAIFPLTASLTWLARSFFVARCVATLTRMLCRRTNKHTKQTNARASPQPGLHAAFTLWESAAILANSEWVATTALARGQAEAEGTLAYS